VVCVSHVRVLFDEHAKTRVYTLLYWNAYVLTCGLHQVNWEALCSAQSRVRELEEALDAQRNSAATAAEQLVEELVAVKDKVAESEAEVRRVGVTLEETQGLLDRAERAAKVCINMCTRVFFRGASRELECTTYV